MANYTLTKSLETALKEEHATLDGMGGINPVNSDNPMTVEGVANKVLSFFATVVGAAILTWLLPLESTAPLLFPALFVGIGLSLWISFSKKVQVGGMFAYSAVQGFILGALSSFFEIEYPGIVQAAVISTLAMAAVMFFGLKFGYIKISDRASKMFGWVMLGYFIFALVQLGLTAFTGGNVYTSEWGWLFALIGVGLATFSIANDFKLASQAIELKLPAENEWRVSFGIIASLIWLYIEILRLFSILNRE